jgi:exodeoxyribonuclease VII small subunit
MAQAAAGDDDVAKMSFEDALEELKQIVERLERGEGKLDEAIDAYDRGARLKRHCEDKLREAKERIEKISLGPDGKPQTAPLDES